MAKKRKPMPGIWWMQRHFATKMAAYLTKGDRKAMKAYVEDYLLCEVMMTDKERFEVVGLIHDVQMGKDIYAESRSA
jgi:diacylglycerol kinase family enzyme